MWKLTNKFPKSEKYNLTSQLRRAATSISSNIAEGASKHTTQDFQRFLYQAYASLKEVESLLLLSKELKYVLVRDFDVLAKEIDELARMIYRFIEVVKKSWKLILRWQRGTYEYFIEGIGGFYDIFSN